MIEDIDRDVLEGYFENRARLADDDASQAYWAGRIDGHCMQNGIDLDALTDLAEDAGYAVDWASGLEGFDA